MVSPTAGDEMAIMIAEATMVLENILFSVQTRDTPKAFADVVHADAGIDFTTASSLRRHAIDCRLKGLVHRCEGMTQHEIGNRLRADIRMDWCTRGVDPFLDVITQGLATRQFEFHLLGEATAT